MKQQMKEFRQAVRAQMPGRGRGRRFPSALRSEAVEIAEDAARAGWDVRQVAQKLGLNAVTLKRWLERAQEEERFPPTLRAVGVVEPAPKERHFRVVVHGPNALRVEGLDLDDLAALWRKLA